MNATLHTVATFHNEIEMIPVKAALEAEDVKCYIKDEYITQMREFSYAGNSGIKLQVEKEDVAKALLILKEIGHSDVSDWEETSLERKLEQKLSQLPFISQLLKFKLPYFLIFIFLIMLLIIFRMQ